MKFKTLERTDKETIRQTINLGFSDYSIPLQFTAEQWNQKIIAENIKWEWSVGAFDGEKLVGVILHAEKKRATSHYAYNAGTAIIPSHRGNKLTRKMYDFILPLLKSAFVDSIFLEVIDSNFPAIASYSAVGFKAIRQLECYKGNINNLSLENNYKVSPLVDLDWSLLQSFWDIKPSWQNDIEAVENSRQQLSSIGLFNHDKLLGYLIYNPNTSRILQIAVSKNHRRQKVATILLRKAVLNKTQPVVVTNIDNSKKDIIAWLKAHHLTHFVTLFEMALQLK